MSNKIDLKQIKAEAKADAKANKVAKTIKVSTVIVSVLVTLAIIASFIGGTVYKSYDQSRINSEAAALVQTLKSQK